MAPDVCMRRAFVRFTQSSRLLANMAPKRARTKAFPEPTAAPLKRSKASKSVADARKAGASQAEAPATTATAATAAAQRPLAVPSGPSYWLVKSEPAVFSIDDLEAKPDQTEHWDGVRSHQAKKVLQSMRAGDQAFFYHSNAKPPGVVGIVEVVREAYPDHTQFEPSSEYFDPKATREKPTWCMVDCRLVRKLARQIPLEELKCHSGPGGALSSMALFKYGRLSVQPVTAAEWAFVLGVEGQAPGGAGQGEAASGAGKHKPAGAKPGRQAAGAAGGKPGRKAAGAEQAAEREGGKDGTAAADGDAATTRSRGRKGRAG